jgi:hypothetical protein
VRLISVSTHKATFWRWNIGFKAAMYSNPSFLEWQNIVMKTNETCSELLFQLLSQVLSGVDILSPCASCTCSHDAYSIPGTRKGMWVSSVERFKLSVVFNKLLVEVVTISAGNFDPELTSFAVKFCLWNLGFLS